MNDEQTVYEITWLVRRLFRAMGARADEYLSSLGISAADRAVMEFLHPDQALSVPAIANRYQVSRQHVQVTVNRLLESGYVQTTANPRHKRSPLILLTQEGSELFLESGNRNANSWMSGLTVLRPSNSSRPASHSNTFTNTCNEENLMHTNDHVLTFRPPRIALGLFVAAALIHFLAPLIVHAQWPVAAVISGATGMFLVLRAWWLFRITGTAICPTATTTTLITGDVYRLTRNPMYLGITLQMLAPALYTGDVLLYAAAIAFLAIIDYHFCPYEERKLAQQYGERWFEYAKRVRRWI